MERQAVTTENGWHEYQKLVISELKRLDATVRDVQKELSHIRTALAILRTRAVTWGALGGIVIWMLTLLANVLTQYIQ